MVSDELREAQSLAMDINSDAEAFHKIDRAITAAIPGIIILEKLLKEWVSAQEPAKRYDARVARTYKALEKK